MLEGLQKVGRRAFVDRPRVGESLDAVGVRVLRRREAALAQAQLAEHVVEGLLRDLPVALLAGDDPGVQIDRREQRVVVEHLLEVRDEPLLVDGVAVEAAAHEVVHAAGRHRVERLRRQLPLAAAEQELERRGRWELRRVAEPAPA